jgi:hypothetical protein
LRHCSSTVGCLPRAVTDDTEPAALHARLEVIVKEAENAEAQAACLLEEESKATALE